MKSGIFQQKKKETLCFILQVFQLIPQRWRVWLVGFEKGRRSVNSQRCSFCPFLYVFSKSFSLMVPDRHGVSLLMGKACFL